MSSDLQTGLLDIAILRLETLPMRAQQYIDQNILDVAIREILDPMKSIATQRGLAQSFIDAMEIRKTGFMQVAFVINYIPGRNGIALNKLLEFGWGDGGYDIDANPEGPMLTWTGGKYGPGFHFAWHVNHPGFRGYHIITSLEHWGFMEVFAFALIRQTSQYLEATAFS